MNESLILKWWWKFKHEKGLLWHRVVTAIHWSPNACTYMLIKAGFAGTWNSIVKVEKDLYEQNLDIRYLIKGNLGDGRDIRFWIDFWVGDGPLMHRFPALFALEVDININVGQRLLGWDWKRAPITGNEPQQLLDCETLLQDISVSQRRDKWVWTESSDGIFSTTVCRKMLARNAVPFYPFEWIKGVPKKVSIHGWKAIQDRLPTLMGLKRRKIIHGSTSCRLCNEGDEDADHLFTSCTFASIVWNNISLWMGIQPIYAFNVKDLLELHKSANTSKEKRSLMRIVILATCWVLWKARNDAIFNGKRANASSVFGEVQATTYTWVKHKLKQSEWTWENWRIFNID